MTQYIFFSGKGGIGKTLLFTTDSSAHIGQVLETDVNHVPVNITGGLWAVNIDQKTAVEEYRRKIMDDARAADIQRNYLPHSKKNWNRHVPKIFLNNN